MDWFRGRLCRIDRVQGLRIDRHQFGIEPALCGDCAGDGGLVVAEIQLLQHIGKAAILAAAIDQDLFARLGRNMKRLIDRQPGLREQSGTVILAGHRLLILLLMELEEISLAGRREESIEGIQAVDIDIDADVLGLEAELVLQQIADQARRTGEIAGLGKGSGARCNGKSGE